MLDREIDCERTSIWAAGLVIGQRDDRLMQGGGIDRGDHSPFLGIEFYEAIDGVGTD